MLIHLLILARIESLVKIAEELLEGLDAKEADYAVKDILPSNAAWEAAMAPFLRFPPRPSTAITSPLGGIVFLVNRDMSDSLQDIQLSIPRDSTRCSAAFRIASFAITILSSSDISGQMDSESLQALFYFLPLAIQLIDDDLSIENCNGITGLEPGDQREEYSEIVYKGRQVVNNWIHSEQSVSSPPGVTISSSFVSLWETKLEGLNESTALDYRTGEVFVKIMSSTEASGKIKSAEEVASICREARRVNTIRSASWFAVLRSAILANPVGNRICNELIADSTGLKPQDSAPDGEMKID